MTLPETIISCLACEESWRRCARHQRDHAAAAAKLGVEQRATLLREAEAADHEADLWRDAAHAARAAAA